MSFPRYESYKDSGVAWLGEVPGHWEVSSLKRFWTVIDCKHITAEFVEDGVPLASIREVQSRYVNLENAKQTTDLFYAQLIESGRKPEPGDLIFSRNATVGEVAQVTEWHPPFAMGQDVCLLKKQTSELSTDYLQAMIQSPLVVEQLENMMIGSTFKRINVEEIRNLVVLMPPVEEQSFISTFLDFETAQIDALIAEQQKLIALLKEKRQAVISHAVTKGLDPTVPMKDSGIEWLGEVPEHWAIVPMKYLIVLNSGGTPSKDNRNYWDGTIPWASAKDLKVDLLSDTGDHITETAVEEGAAFVNRAGVILVVVRGMILAKTFPVVQTLVPMAINQDLKVIQPLEMMEVRFLVWLLRGTEAESMRRTDEAGHGTKALRMEAWTSMLVPVPCLKEQTTIAAFIDRETAKIDELTTEAQRGIELLKERRSALISAAVTGKIDVRGWTPPEAV